jgi:hypothetical protein
MLLRGDLKLVKSYAVLNDWDSVSGDIELLQLFNTSRVLLPDSPRTGGRS